MSSTAVHQGEFWELNGEEKGRENWMAFCFWGWKKERKKRRTNKDLFPFPFVKWKPFRADWALPCYRLSSVAWCSAWLCSDDTKGSCYFWRLKLLCSAEGTCRKISDPWERTPHSLLYWKLALRKQIWLLVYQFALEWSGQGYLGIDVAKLELKKKRHTCFRSVQA